MDQVTSQDQMVRNSATQSEQRLEELCAMPSYASKVREDGNFIVSIYVGPWNNRRMFRRGARAYEKAHEKVSLRAFHYIEGLKQKQNVSKQHELR